MSGSGINLPPAAVRAPQLVVAALTAGCLVLLGVALVVVGPPIEAAGIPLLTGVALLVAGAMVCGRFVLPAIITAQTRRRILQSSYRTTPPTMPDSPPAADEVQRLLQAALSRTILSAVLMESATLFLLVVYFIERSPFSLFAAVLTIVMLAAGFPTAPALKNWIEHQTRLVEQQRQFL